MTVVIACVQRGGWIVPLDQDKIKRWKKRHAEGEVYEMILDDGQSSGLSTKAKEFHAIRDEYAEINGYDNDHAKIELKHLHGVVGSEPQVGRLGRMIDYHGVLEWQLSIIDYSHEELVRLVNGSRLALQEASV